MLRLALNLLLLLGVSLADYATGTEVQFGSFYLLAVALAAWNLRPRLVGVHAVLTVAVWMVVGSLAGLHFSRPWIWYWNTANRLGTIAIVATAVSIIKATLDRQRVLIRELGRTSLDASQLRELIPVCRVCHLLQVGPEYGEKVRHFLEEDPEADSVGGICPGCQRARREWIARIPVERYFQAGTPGAGSAAGTLAAAEGAGGGAG